MLFIITKLQLLIDRQLNNNYLNLMQLKKF